jgi:hypothetical protein
MTSVANLGVNYKSAHANWATDAAYLKSVGVVAIRPNLSNIPTNFTPPGSVSAGSYEYWRNCAIYFASQGFWVSWGSAGSTTAPLTATAWTQYRTDILADAAYMQAQGIVLGAYELGNEMETHVDGTTLTQTQFIANMRQLATDVQAVYTLSPIAYSCFDTGGTTYSTWVSGGLGGLDLLGLHPYGNVGANGKNYSNNGFNTTLATTVAALANKVYFSEWGIDATTANYTASPMDYRSVAMRNLVAKLKTYSGVKYNILYTYCGYLNGDNQFAVANTDGSFDPQWDILLHDSNRVYNITS